MTSSSWWLNHPFETYDRQIGSFLQVAVQITNKKMKPPARLYWILHDSKHDK